VFTNEKIGYGYLRKDGKKGIRNKGLIIFTVDCSSYVAQKISEHFRQLGEDVDVVGSRPCLDNQVNIRRLLSYSVHPNVGATLVVGHGCEFTQPEKISEFAKKNGRISEWIYTQEFNGTIDSISKGIEILSKMLENIKNIPRVPLYLKDLVFGGECGGSDFTSGLAGNTLVGSFFDEIIDLGGTCIFEEMTEAIGLRDYLAIRASNKKARQEIVDTYDKSELICKMAGQYAISPGNIRGGLSTIEEKSMGAVTKSGTKPIQGVLKIAQRPPKPGLWILDRLQDEHFDISHISGGDANSMMDLITLGTHFCFLVTGRGHVVCNPISPTIKITGNTTTYENMANDIDINAGQLLTGDKTLSELTVDLLDYIVSLCNGKATKGEKLGHREGEFFPNYQIPDRVVRPKQCDKRNYY